MTFLKQINKLVLWCLFLSGFTSCFSKYIYTDKEINKYYQNKTYKPVSHFATYKTKKIHYVEFGDTSKPLLLLIHGAPGAWYTWMNFVDNDSLRQNYHLLIVDRLGYGKSNYGKADIDIENQVYAIQQIISNYANKPIHLVGRSYGAPIAAALASLNNNRCKQLVLYSPVISPYVEKKYWFSAIAKAKPVQLFLPKSINVATQEKFAHVNQMQCLLSYYGNIKANVCIVAGKKDWVAHASNFRVCDSLLNSPLKKTFLLEKAGHFLTFDYPNTMCSFIYKPITQLKNEEITQGIENEIVKTQNKN